MTMSLLHAPWGTYKVRFCTPRRETDQNENSRHNKEYISKQGQAAFLYARVCVVLCSLLVVCCCVFCVLLSPVCVISCRFTLVASANSLAHPGNPHTNGFSPEQRTQAQHTKHTWRHRHYTTWRRTSETLCSLWLCCVVLPVCIRICLLSVDVSGNFLSHMLHVCGFSPVCFFM